MPPDPGNPGRAFPWLAGRPLMARVAEALHEAGVRAAG